MAFPVKKKQGAPRRKQDRIILHFDYDCFYAQVVENAQPALRSLPLGIRQKGTLATCNYEARRRGVRKLQPVADALRACPDLVLAAGEDLSAFRDVSRRLYGVLAGAVAGPWGSRAERLGLDEVFLDVTDVVEYNVGLLNRGGLEGSFFCLDWDDPERGFGFDASCVAGCMVGEGHGEDGFDNLLYVRLLLASHLARHLRLKLEEEGYTSACGISTCKVLSKLVGAVNKPRNQTTLLSLHEDEVLAFMDSHTLRKVPGIGGKTTHALESYLQGGTADTDTTAPSKATTVGDFRTRPEASPQMLERLLGSRPGSERGIGDKVWGLLHGVDGAEVKAASSLPTQISIEDTYPGPHAGLNTPAEVERELLKLAGSLLRRMRVDLTESGDTAGGAHFSTDVSKGRRRRRWTARPRTLRLSTRPKTFLGESKPYNWARASRSQPLPGFIFHDDVDDSVLVRRLVAETLLPMFYRLNPRGPGGAGWNIGMINICVANMTPEGGGDAAGVGRDISQMFRRQDDVLRGFRVYDTGDEGTPRATGEVDDRQGGENDEAGGGVGSAFLDDHEEVGSGSSDAEPEPEPEPWDGLDGSQACGRCGHCWPSFAITAHERYHDLEDR